MAGAQWFCADSVLTALAPQHSLRWLAGALRRRYVNQLDGTDLDVRNIELEEDLKVLMLSSPPRQRPANRSRPFTPLPLPPHRKRQRQR